VVIQSADDLSAFQVPDGEEVEEIEMDSPRTSAQPGLNVPIRTDYVRQRKTSQPETYMKSPITGEMIRESELAHHMRVVLLDPKWKHQSEVVLKRARESGSAYADDVADNIAEFVKRRPDLFGSDTGEDGASRDIHADTAVPTQSVIGPTMPAPPPPPLAVGSPKKRARKL
jgi:hypothetical protein